MKATLKIPQEFELKTLLVEAEVRYWDDATVDGEEDTEGKLMPCRKGDLWNPIINIDSGIITNWTKGVTANVHYKVCDSGCYYLQDSEGKGILSIENDSVPKIMCPKENGYGDYIIMDIDENGKIADWKPSLDGFINNNED